MHLIMLREPRLYHAMLCNNGMYVSTGLLWSDYAVVCSVLHPYYEYGWDEPERAPH